MLVPLRYQQSKNHLLALPPFRENYILDGFVQHVNGIFVHAEVKAQVSRSLLISGGWV